jgi:hypothetical protein
MISPSSPVSLGSGSAGTEVSTRVQAGIYSVSSHSCQGESPIYLGKAIEACREAKPGHGAHRGSGRDPAVLLQQLGATSSR